METDGRSAKEAENDVGEELQDLVDGTIFGTKIFPETQTQDEKITCYCTNFKNQYHKIMYLSGPET